MGQAYSMTTFSAASASIDVPELSDLSLDRVLASTRFSKSVRTKSRQGFVFVRALVKPYSSFDVRSYVKQLADERDILASIPNTLGYHRIVEVSNGGFLVRQHIFSSVYDRLSTRPFLEDIEKRWLSFQLLCAVKDCHALNLYHGDIKTENLLVTSWNWLYLTDFSASFKPTCLPEDNPADFTFYFDTSGRRICYLAPERFISNRQELAPNSLNWSMDMFSVGCAIAEIFLEGPIFTLSQIFKYKSGEYDPIEMYISKIDDQEVRAMIMNMIDLDPERRYSAEQHLNFYKDKLFPEYFYGFLHGYLHALTEPTTTNTPLNLSMTTLNESDRKIEQVQEDFDKIVYLLDFKDVQSSPTNLLSTSHQIEATKCTQDLMPAKYHPNDGTLLIVSILSAAIRNTSRASVRAKACDLLAVFAHRLPDEAKLDRILPYVASMLSDKADIVKIAALYATASILYSVRAVTPINAYIFPEYVLPKLRQFIELAQNDPDKLVRSAYASCLGKLALSSQQMLDVVQAIRADGRFPALSEESITQAPLSQNMYDAARAEITPLFEESTISLITDSDISVRRALLASVADLCVFFGSSQTSDIILSHLNTYLSEPDWVLRSTFCDSLVSVATCVGASSLEQFILPIMLGMLFDTEYFVLEKLLRTMARIAALGLFSRKIILKLIEILSRFLWHPAVWVREAATLFIARACEYLSISDKYCIVAKTLEMYLRVPATSHSEEDILNKLKSPLARAVFDAALAWATRRPRSSFWLAAADESDFTISEPLASLHKQFQRKVLSTEKDKDDLQSLETLRKLGMNADDEIKLMALREYILRLSQSPGSGSPNIRTEQVNRILSFAELDIAPQNVFFDTLQPYSIITRHSFDQHKNHASGHQKTLSDALLDASTNVGSARVGLASEPSDSQRDKTEAPSQDQDPQVASAAHNESVLLTAVDRVLPVRSGQGVGDGATLATSLTSKHSLLEAGECTSSRRGSTQPIKRGNAFRLMKTESMKAEPELSTSRETASGRFGGRTHSASVASNQSLSVPQVAIDKSRSRSPEKSIVSSRQVLAHHSYTGADPTILKLLDSHISENYAIEQHDFGETQESPCREQPIRSAQSSSSPATSVTQTSLTIQENWRPSGSLLTQFTEHTASVNCVVASADDAFFVTGSDDGTCKIWDTSRLERNLTSRSRFTHHHARSSRVKALCFIQNTHTFISSADDGSIHAVRVDVKLLEGSDVNKFSTPVLVRDWQIPDVQCSEKEESSSRVTQEYAIWLHHYRGPGSQSILLIVTSQSRVLMVDLKNMEIIHVMHNPLHQGKVTAACIDKNQHWLLLGTMHGVLDLWDLRFRLRLKSIGIGGAGLGQDIGKLLIHPSRGNGKWVIVSCGGEMSVWDIEKLICREVLRPSTFVSGATKKRYYEVWHPDEDSGQQILQALASGVDNEVTIGAKTPDEVVLGKVSGGNPSSNTITSMLAFQDVIANKATPDMSKRISLMLSVGHDRTIRYWDLAHSDQNFIVSGPMINKVGEEARTKARYEVSWPTSMSLSGLVQLVEEKLSETQDEDDKTISGSGASTPRRKQDTLKSTKGVSRTLTQAGRSPNIRVPRNTIISQGQQQLLKTHMDGINDVCLLRKPYGCIVTVDRGGNVFVFQ